MTCADWGTSAPIYYIGDDGGGTFGSGGCPDYQIFNPPSHGDWSEFFVPNASWCSSQGSSCQEWWSEYSSSYVRCTPVAETSCQATNACGLSNTGWTNHGSGCNVSPPSLPAGYGNSCSSSANACGQAGTGTIGCDGSCSAGGQSLPGNYGQSCSATSATNACGQANTNYGTYGCSGSCSASTPAAPSDAGCNQPPNIPQFSYLYDLANSAYLGHSGLPGHGAGYRVYLYATDPDNNNVAIRYQFYNAQTGQVYAENWASPTWVGSGGWTTADSFSNFAPGTYYVRAYSYDTWGATSAWSDWQPIYLANQPPNIPQFSYLYQDDTSVFTGSTATANYPAGYRVYMFASDPEGDNVANRYQLYNAQTGQIFAENWASPTWVGSGGWTLTINFANFPIGTYYVRAYSYDSNGATSAWSEWQPITLTDPPVSVSCGASPTSIYEGQSATWTSSASGGTGTYSYSWSGTDGLSGTGSSVSKTYAAPGAKTAMLTVSSGSAQTTVSCAADANPGDGTVTVASCGPTLSANPSTVDVGQTTDLNWSVPAACASSCIFSDGHAAGRSGTYTVTPPLPSSGNTDMYAVTCPANSSKTAQTAVTVLVPAVSISATPDRVKSGDPSTIAWTASNVNTCDITKNGAAWKAGLAADISRQVTGTAPDTVTVQSTYKITCVNGSGAVQAQASATVNVVPGFTEF